MEIVSKCPRRIVKDHIDPKYARANWDLDKLETEIDRSMPNVDLDYYSIIVLDKGFCGDYCETIFTLIPYTDKFPRASIVITKLREIATPPDLR